MAETQTQPDRPTKEQVEKYVATLSDDIAVLYRRADRLTLEIGDTLCEEFQIVAAIVDVFVRRTRRFYD